MTQVANALHSLGVQPRDVVSLLLPLMPQAFYALYGTQAAGIANPVNSFLEAGQIAHILRAARTKVLITLGPAEGFNTWEKVKRIRDDLPDLKPFWWSAAQACSPRAPSTSMRSWRGNRGPAGERTGDRFR